MTDDKYAELERRVARLEKDAEQSALYFGVISAFAILALIFGWVYFTFISHSGG